LNPRPLGYEPYDVCLWRPGPSPAGAVTSADRPGPISLGRLRLPRLVLSRRVRFTNRFTEQSRRNGLDPRPSAFQAGHIPSWQRSRGRYVPSPLAAGCRWSLLLLSPLLSAASPVPHFRGLPADDSVTPWSSPPSPGLFPATWPRPVLSQAPPPNPIAAEPYGRRVLSRVGVADHE
jgi:hypothetical protein